MVAPPAADASGEILAIRLLLTSTFVGSVNESLASVVDRVDCIEVPAGEASKSVAEAGRLWQEMLSFSADRKSVVVALGGGVVGDLAGFIAASFARGIPLFQIPTTLLAQVDSSVGGKVGINLPGAKNMVGAFWQPHSVVIDTQVLDSLPGTHLVFHRTKSTLLLSCLRRMQKHSAIGCRND